jgi:hypothetical protein
MLRASFSKIDVPLLTLLQNVLALFFVVVVVFNINNCSVVPQLIFDSIWSRIFCLLYAVSEYLLTHSMEQSSS